MDSTAAPSTYNVECPFSIQWTITEEKLAALKDSTTNGFLETEKFNVSNIPGVKYHLKIYPNGNKEQYRGKVRIFLHLRIGNETKIKADVKFLVDPACYSYTLKYEFTKSWGWGPIMCKAGELFDPVKKFIVNGYLSIKCEGILSVVREKLAEDENGIKIDVGQVGHKLWSSENKDFLINVGKKSVKVHKCILAAQSPVFKTMFQSGMKESKESQMVITDFSFKAVQNAIQLCYNVASLDGLSMKDKRGLLQFCDKYDIRFLKARIEASLISDVSTSTLCTLSKCSIFSNALKLEGKCAELLTECIKSGTPVNDIDRIDNGFLLKVVTKACSQENLVVDEGIIDLDDELVSHKLWENEDKDFIIKVGESCVKVHKCILAALSPNFKSMFESGTNKSKQDEMVINNFSFNVVETAIQLCYLGETLNVLSIKDKMGLLHFCDQYYIDGLKTRVEASLIEDVSISNVCEIANCSILSNANKLEEKCAEFLSVCITSRTPVADIALLDINLSHKIFANSFSNIVKT